MRILNFYLLFKQRYLKLLHMYNYEKKFTFYINIWNRDILKIFAWNNFKNKWLMYQIKSLTLKMFHWCPMSPGPPPPLSCPSMAAPFWHLRRKIGLIKITIYYHDEKGKLRKNTIVCIILLIFRANRKKKSIIVQLTFFAPWDYNTIKLFLQAMKNIIY